MFLHREQQGKETDVGEMNQKRLVNHNTKLIIAKNRQGATGIIDLIFRVLNRPSAKNNKEVMPLFDRLDIIEARYQQLHEQLENPDILGDIKKYTSLMKELRSLETIVETYRQYKKNKQTIDELKELSKEKDQEIAELAKAELEEHNAIAEKLEEDLKVLLLPKDENDEKNVIVEIRGAAGGDEANLFAADLFRMYSKYAEIKGWKIEVMNADETGLGGFASIEFMVSGESVYSFLNMNQDLIVCNVFLKPKQVDVFILQRQRFLSCLKRMKLMFKSI
jgi:hypothetical protein